MGETLTVLLVEDEPMATMPYEQFLKGTEFQLTGTFTCNGDAVGWLSANRPDVAIVDFFLEDGPCEPVMTRLEELNIPYVIVTGSGEAHPSGCQIGGTSTSPSEAGICQMRSGVWWRLPQLTRKIDGLKTQGPA